MNVPEHEEPEDARLSPMCGLWTQTQELNSLSKEAQNQLAWKRRWHEEHGQCSTNKCAPDASRMEHPKTARSANPKGLPGTLSDSTWTDKVSTRTPRELRPMSHPMCRWQRTSTRTQDWLGEIALPHVAWRRHLLLSRQRQKDIWRI